MLFYFSVELQGCSESALGHDCMDAGGRTNQETESRSPYARAERNKRTPRVPVGQFIWGGLDVQDAQMSRVHGCTRATLFVSFLWPRKEK